MDCWLMESSRRVACQGPWSSGFTAQSDDQFPCLVAGGPGLRFSSSYLIMTRETKMS